MKLRGVLGRVFKPDERANRGRRRTKRKQEDGGEFVVASGDTTEFFDAAEKVFDVMAKAVVTAMEPRGLPATLSGRNAAAGVLPAQLGAKPIAVINARVELTH